MALSAPAVSEAYPGSTPLRDLRLSIVGTPLEGVIAAFQAELAEHGINRVAPHFYLSTEWGVPFGTVSIAIPFYLARSELTALHATRAGHVEGVDSADILRYLRHEMGHVLNYAYRLYERDDWRRAFGNIDLPYEEEFRPRPFSREFVQHLPGWYAQKHPDEDWAETFAVWLTPGSDWRADYAGWPALEKLLYCDRVIAEVRDKTPPVTATDPDEDVGELAVSLDDFYRRLEPTDNASTSGMDAALRSVFPARETAGNSEGNLRPGEELIRKLITPLAAEVYRWTGHFPERTRLLLRHLADRAQRLGLAYPATREAETTVALTTFMTALATHRVAELTSAGPTP